MSSRPLAPHFPRRNNVCGITRTCCPLIQSCEIYPLCSYNGPFEVLEIRVIGGIPNKIKYHQGATIKTAAPRNVIKYCSRGGSLQVGSVGSIAVSIIAEGNEELLRQSVPSTGKLLAT